MLVVLVFVLVQQSMLVVQEGQFSAPLLTVSVDSTLHLDSRDTKMVEDLKLEIIYRGRLS